MMLGAFKNLKKMYNIVHRYGGVAQLGERLLCKQEVRGSSPLSSTEFPGCRKGTKSIMPDISISDKVHTKLQDMAFLQELTVDEVLSDVLGISEVSRTRINSNDIGPADLYQTLVLLVGVAYGLDRAEFSGLIGTDKKNITVSRKFVQDQIFEMLGSSYFVHHRDELQSVSQGLPRWKNRIGNALATLTKRGMLEHSRSASGKLIPGSFVVTKKGYVYIMTHLLDKSHHSYRDISVKYPRVYSGIISLIDKIKP